MSKAKGRWGGLLKDRDILWGLAKNDFKARYATSFLGVSWAFVQPLVMILVMWFIFQVGLRNEPVEGQPFIVWFVPAYLAWSYFSDALTSTTNSFREYEYLLKQVNFRVGIIPIIKILSSTFVHVVFIMFMYFVLAVNKVRITLYSVQVVYYFICVFCLLIALGILFATLNSFIPDIASFVGIAMTVGFWASPICWSPVNMATPFVQTLLKLNPMYYVCQGYRDSFLVESFFWEQPVSMLIFWGEVILFYMIGRFLFKRTRPYLVDLL